MFPKIRQAKDIVQKKNLGFAIEVDGGVTPENIGTLSEAGVDIFVAGASIFGSSSYSETINKMKGILAGS
jgi:ribulose-phosphate 3-epimerase